MGPLDIIFIVFVAAAVVQGLYYGLFFSRFAFHKEEQQAHANSRPEPLSVVICAKNEADNLLENLPLILDQDYPDFEVVVVNDASWDSTPDVLIAFANKYPNFKAVTVNQTSTEYKGKKLALTLGIKGASNELLVLTDADCKPNSRNWLREQARQFQPGTEIVLGYGAYEKKSGLLNRLIRFDTFYVALQYLSLALSGLAYMGVGRNLAYRKSVFFANKGFASHTDIASGDDDLFINEVAKKNNTRIVDSIESITVSEVKETFKDWVDQKRRHVTTGNRYKLRDKMLLGMLSLSQTLFFFTLILLLIFGYQTPVVLSIFGARLLLQALLFHRAMSRLGEGDLVYLFPVLELILTVMYPLLYLSNLIYKRPSWKS